MKGIAVFGGTFNPVHIGHLRSAEEVREALDFRKVIFMPASQPPHKPGVCVAPAEDRLAMTALATEKNPFFEVSDMEIKRGGRSFTIDTVRQLMKEGFGPGEIHLLVGTDSFNEITTWCDYETLVGLASFVVVPRPGSPVKKIAEVLPESLARKYGYDSSTGRYVTEGGASVTYLATTLMDISSSEIRRKLAEGLSVRYLMPGAVENYIIQRGLYKRGEGE